jgi:hypothetical protein
MLIAKIENGQVVDVADYQSMFPNTSFAETGPSKEFMVENNCMPLNLYLDHDPETQFLEHCDPYIMGDWVYTIKVSQLDI